VYSEIYERLVPKINILHVEMSADIVGKITVAALIHAVESALSRYLLFIQRFTSQQLATPESVPQDDQKIAEFQARSVLPDQAAGQRANSAIVVLISLQIRQERPAASQWRRWQDSPVYKNGVELRPQSPAAPQAGTGPCCRQCAHEAALPNQGP
jgi:hypothetical protein